MLTKTIIEWVERGLVPDFLIRTGIRRLLAQRLREQERGGEPAQTQLLVELHNNPVALYTDAANEQHYELPPEFFRHIMGQHLKYSACYWPPGVTTLTEAEAAMLSLSCERARLENHQTILELGCGWGSLTLWMAENYPDSRITAVSNSPPQRHYIENECQRRGLTNVCILTADMNDFSSDGRFDRVVSVEMFEHMRNYRELLARIDTWLKPGGELFVHIFSHRRFAYPFESQADDDWMGRYFFTGGLMPSRDLLVQFQDHLSLEQRWQISGLHYQHTCEAWLANQDRNREPILTLFRDVYGTAQATRWFQRWRVFFIACAELFGYRSGEEWGVSHYRFRKKSV